MDTKEKQRDIRRAFYEAQAQRRGHGEEWVEQQVRQAVERSGRLRIEREEQERREKSAADLVYKQLEYIVDHGRVHYSEIPRRNPLKSVDDATWAEAYSRLQATRRRRAAYVIERIWKFDKKEIIGWLGRGGDAIERYRHENYAEAAHHAFLADYIKVLRQVQADHDRLADALEKEMGEDA